MEAPGTLMSFYSNQIHKFNRDVRWIVLNSGNIDSLKASMP